LNSRDIEGAATAGGIACIDTLVYDPQECVVRITFLRNPEHELPDVVGWAEWAGVTDFHSTLHEMTDNRAEFEAGLWLEQLIGIHERAADSGHTVFVCTDIREVAFITVEPPCWIPLPGIEPH
jgi:hypothetical protein